MKKIAAVAGLVLLVPLATCRDAVAPAPASGIAAVSVAAANLVTTWAPIADMVTGREGAAVANDGSGHIYAFGGIGFGGSLSSVERYDAATNTWMGVPAFPTAVHAAAAVRHGNGLIYIAGGSRSNAFSAAFTRFDQTTGTYTNAAPMSVARFGPAIGLLPNGKIIVAGGGMNNTTTLSSAELYDPTTNTWTATGSMPVARYAAVGVMGSNGKFYVFGGIAPGNVFLSSVSAYDPGTGTWSAAASMPGPRYYYGAVPLASGKILVYGGGTGTSVTASVIAFDPASNSWEAAGSMNVARNVAGYGLLPDGRAVAFGGENNTEIFMKSGEAGTEFQPATTTMLTSSPNPSALGQTVNFTITVTSNTPQAPIAGEVVSIVDGPNVLASVILSGSGATTTIPVSSLSVGSHFLIAYYASSTLGLSSSSGVFTQVVNKSASATGVTQSDNPSTYSNTHPFTIQVTPANGTGVPTGPVSLLLDGQPYTAPAPLSGGQTTSPPIANLGAGSHIFTVNYGGDANFASSSTTFTQVVNLGVATTTLASSQNPSLAGQQVTLTATLDAPGLSGQGNPTGTVTFYDCGVPVGTSPVSNRTAQLTASFTFGSHTLTATYSGDGNYATSTSPAVDQTTTLIATTTSLTSDHEPSVVGQMTTFTATVAFASPGVSGTPSGTVRFTIFGSPLSGQIPLVNGVATSPAILFGVGPVPIGAEYSGDANTAATTTTITHTTRRASVAIVVAAPSTAFGQTTITANVAGLAFAPIPNDGELVTFSENGTPLGGAPTVLGVATLNVPALGAGSHTIVATYGGNHDLLPGTGTGIVLVAKVASSTTLTAAANPTIIGNAVNYTAHVTSASGFGGVPGGTATFSVDGNPYASNVPVQPDGSAAAPALNGLSLGAHTISVSYGGDANFNGSSAQATHTVNLPPDFPPVANAGPDQSTVGGASGASVTLNGTASTDPDDGIASYAWSEGGVSIASGATASITLAVGTHTITLRTTDTYGLYSDDVVVVTVLSAAAAIQQLNATVQSLLASGAISSNTAQQFTTSLNAAAASLASGNTTAASNQLGAFINKVQAALNSGKISAANAAALIAYAQQIQNSM